MDVAEAIEQAALIAENWGKPGEGGINITNGVPSVIHVGIMRGHYESEHEVAVAVVKAARKEISTMIRNLAPQQEAPPCAR